MHEKGFAVPAGTLTTTLTPAGGSDTGGSDIARACSCAVAPIVGKRRCEARTAPVTDMLTISTVAAITAMLAALLRKGIGGGDCYPIVPR